MATKTYNDMFHEDICGNIKNFFLKQEPGVFLVKFMDDIHGDNVDYTLFGEVLEKYKDKVGILCGGILAETFCFVDFDGEQQVANPKHLERIFRQ